MKCPVCGCQGFYVKDPEDEFETYELRVGDGGIAFEPGTDASAAPALGDATETFCNKCSWHGKLGELDEPAR
jgi:hypothetical protein